MQTVGANITSRNSRNKTLEHKMHDCLQCGKQFASNDEHVGHELICFNILPQNRGVEINDRTPAQTQHQSNQTHQDGSSISSSSSSSRRINTRFTCTICAKSFTQKNNLNRILRLYI